jgi:predicted nucleic acid-binding protein
MTLVDTNVISDILSGDADWLQWSASATAMRLSAGPLFTTDVVYAELGIRMTSVDELDRRLDLMEIEVVRTPRAALLRAGHAYLAYRRRGGLRSGVLPDFFIGAHAEVAGLTLLTRDARRYRTYFPKVRLITP